MNALLAIFASGPHSEGIIFATIINGKIIGADLFGSLIDGSIREEAGSYRLKIDISVPSGTILVQGDVAPPEGLYYSIDSLIPNNFSRVPFVEIDTPLGRVNARFQILREIPGEAP